MSMVPRYAADMLLEKAAPEHGDENSPLTNLLLRQITVLDDWGAWDWNLRWASFYWFLFFALVRLVLAKRGGIEWYAFIHGVITGIGGVACAYLTFVSAESLTGTPEPLGSVLCHGPLTSLHRVLPTAACGYSVFDLFDGMFLGTDFMFHGAAMFFFSTYIMETNMQEVLAIMLALEFSTPFLNFVRAKWLPPKVAMANMLAFVVAFFLARIVYGPYAIYKYCSLLYTVGRTAEESKQCLPRGFDHVIFVTGMFFNILNSFWFYKIIRKLQRKLNGTEGIKHSNDYMQTPEKGNNNAKLNGNGGGGDRKVKFKKEQD